MRRCSVTYVFSPDLIRAPRATCRSHDLGKYQWLYDPSALGVRFVPCGCTLSTPTTLYKWVPSTSSCYHRSGRRLLDSPHPRCSRCILPQASEPRRGRTTRTATSNTHKSIAEDFPLRPG